MICGEERTRCVSRIPAPSVKPRLGRNPVLVPPSKPLPTTHRVLTQVLSRSKFNESPGLINWIRVETRGSYPHLKKEGNLLCRRRVAEPYDRALAGDIPVRAMDVHDRAHRVDLAGFLEAALNAIFRHRDDKGDEEKKKKWSSIKERCRRREWLIDSAAALA